MTARISDETRMNETSHPPVQDRYADLVAQYPQIFPAPGPDQSFSNLPTGWWGITSELASRLLLMPGLEKVRVRQVKEKWGVLTIYAFPRRSFSLDDPQVAAIRYEISKVRKESESICLYCGAAGAELKRLSGWVATVCPAHTYGGTLLPVN